MSRESKKQILFIKNQKPYFELKKSHKKQKKTNVLDSPLPQIIFKVTPEEVWQMDEEKKQEEFRKIYCRFLFAERNSFFDGTVSLKLRKIRLIFPNHFTQPNHPELLGNKWWNFRPRPNDIRADFLLLE